MKNRPSRLKLLLTIAALLLMHGAQAQEEPVDSTGPELDKVYSEQIVRIPLSKRPGKVELEATIIKPHGDGPFPLAVFNHGKAPGKASLQKRARYLAAGHALVRRGFVVLMPMRQGFSQSGGTYRSMGCDVTANARNQADDVIAAIDFARTLPYVDAKKIVVMGTSHGGLTTIALGEREVPGLLGLVNFVGGLRQQECKGWEDNLVHAFAELGKAARYPSLSLYGDNDSYWSPDLSQRIFAAYSQGAGQQARLVRFGTFKDDSHMLFGQVDGLPIWLPAVDKFLAPLGLDLSFKPDMVAVTLKNPVPPASGFAALDDEQAPPYLSAKGRAAYSRWLTLPAPRAFAIGRNGAYALRFNDDYASDAAVEKCSELGGKECRLYAVNETVVWSRAR